jgi:hypothetical protein
MDFFAISSFALIEKIVSKEKYFPPFWGEVLDKVETHDLW